MDTKVRDSGRQGRPAPGRSMKIYFCDICNESIPLKDINSNRITIEEGKIFCQKCAPKKGRANERVPMPILATMGVLVLVVLGLGLMGWKLVSEQASDINTLETTVATLNRSLGDLPTQLGTIATKVEGIDGRVQELSDDLTTSRTELQQHFERLDDSVRAHHKGYKKEIQGAVDGVLKDLGEEISDLKDQVSNVATELRSDVQTRIKLLQEKVELLQDVVTSRGGAPGPGPSADVTPKPGRDTPPAPDAAEDREINGHIAKLADPDAGKRYAAVIALGRFSGPKVVKALEGMLRDPEDYVRVAVIQNLRKLNSVSSIPHIIDALRDKDYFVRVAAVGALRSLTSEKLNFDPDTSPSDRESKVKAWEKWWGENQSKLLKGS